METETQIERNHLKTLFTMQAKLITLLDARYQEQGIGIDATAEDKEAMSKRALTTLAAMGNELQEVVNELPWKTWKEYGDLEEFFAERDSAGRTKFMKLKEESVDLLFFLLELFIVLGMSAEEVFEIYEWKFNKNVARVDGDWANATR